MLTLNRKAKVGRDEIRIGKDIVIKVLRVVGGDVVIGISAPRATSIVRGELIVELGTVDPVAERAADVLGNRLV